MFNLPEEVIFYIYQLYFKDYVLNELLSKYNNQLKRDPKDNFKISFINVGKDLEILVSTNFLLN